jgi:hypothetical protein
LEGVLEAKLFRYNYVMSEMKRAFDVKNNEHPAFAHGPPTWQRDLHKGPYCSRQNKAIPCAPGGKNAKLSSSNWATLVSGGKGKVACESNSDFFLVGPGASGGCRIIGTGSIY